MYKKRNLYLTIFILFAIAEIVLVLILGLNSHKLGKFTIDFETNGGTPVAAVTLQEGSTIDPIPVPFKDGYLFYGWYYEDTLTHYYDYSQGVHSNLTLYARWTLIPGTHFYAINWLNWDGTLLEHADVLEGTTPQYHQTLPTKAATSQYSYDFIGWSPTVEVATQDAIYTAIFAENIQTYDVQFIVNGVVVLSLNNIYYGTVITSYTGINPIKPSTAQWDYTFSGWDHPFEVVTSNQVYYAIFSETLRSYDINWEYDGQIIKTDLAQPYGSALVPPTSLTPKPEDAQYVYTFAGWSPNVTTVNGALTLVAQFTTEVKKYTVVWSVNGADVQIVNNVPYGTVVTFSGPTPTKASDAQYIYTFSGWSPSVAAITGHTTYVAQFSTQTKSYSVTWQVSGVNAEIDQNVLYGTTPSYDGTTPSKPADAGHIYTFVGWSATSNGSVLTTLPAVSANVTYYAIFDFTLISYEITWVLASSTFTSNHEYGTTPTFTGVPSVPTKPADLGYTYTFDSWSPAIASVTGSATYTAIFIATPITYLITWVVDEQVTKTQTVAYGSLPTYDLATPSKTATAQYTYTFTGWSPAVSLVSEAATYTAVFSQTTNTYTVTWINDGNVVKISLGVAYGQIPDYGSTPTKATTVQYTYTFTGWATTSTGSPLLSLPAVTGNVTYYAIYDEVTRSYSVTWMDDTLVVYTNMELYGTTPVYGGTSLSKSPDAQYASYTLSWDPAVSSVTGDVVYHTHWIGTLQTYTISWNTPTTEEEAQTEVAYGTVPVYPNSTPTKATTAQYYYEFKGWSTTDNNIALSSLPAVTQDATYYACFNNILRTYTLTWVINSQVVKVDILQAYGSTPYFGEATPTKAPTTQVVYTFDGWSPSLSSVTSNATYTATFSESPRPYVITWVLANSIVTSSATYNSAPVFPDSTPLKASDIQYTYTFAGWSSAIDGLILGALPLVTGPATYYAIFDANGALYTITWQISGSPDVIELNVPYGSTPSYPNSTPVKAPDATYTYTFSGWSPNIGTVTGNQTYEALFTSSLRTYVITFIIGEDEYPQNITVGVHAYYTGATPTQDSDAQFDYYFIGWSTSSSSIGLLEELPSVTGDATYYACFDATYHPLTVTFVSGGQILKIEVVTYGANATPPTNTYEPEYAYFDAWDNNYLAVTSSVTCYALFNSVFTYDTPVDNQVNIIGYYDMPGRYHNIVIPSVIDGYTVVGLDTDIFIANVTPIYSIVVPDTVEFIALGALSYLKDLQEITLPFVGNSLYASGEPSKFGYIFGTNYYLNSTQIGDYYLPNNISKVVLTQAISIPDNSFESVPDQFEIVLPNTLLTIGSLAFKTSGLTKIIIPNSVVNIYASAFENCLYLSYVVIGNGVTSISDSTFKNSTALNSIDLNNVTSLGDYAFAGSSIYSIIFHEGFTIIGDYAFAGCQILRVMSLPDTLLSIGPEAFSDCRNLKSVVVPNSVTSIGAGAFSGTQNLSYLSIPFVGLYPGASGGGAVLGIIFGLASGSLIANYYLANSYYLPKALHTVVITGDYEDIPVQAFKECTYLTAVILPDSINEILEEAFAYCANLTSINLPLGLTFIDVRAFYQSGLTSLVIPNSVLVIGEEAFSDNASLRSVSLGTSLEEIHQGAFSGSALESINIPDSVHFMGAWVFYNTAVVTAVLGRGVSVLPDRLFYYCLNLVTVLIPEGVTGIGTGAFAVCYSLVNVSFPNGLLSIASDAFNSCTSLSIVNLPDTLLSIDEYAFAWCSSLINLVIPESVVSIQGWILQGANHLQSLTIPFIGTNIFNPSELGYFFSKAIFSNSYVTANDYYIPLSLTDIIITKATSLAAETFYGFTSLTSIILPESLLEINAKAFMGCSNLTSLVLPNNLQFIGAQAFTSTNLSSLVIPDSVNNIEVNILMSIPNFVSLTTPFIGSNKDVSQPLSYFFYLVPNQLHTVVISAPYDTQIADDCFNGLSQLTSVILGPNITVIGENAFKNCTGLTSIVIPDKVYYLDSFAFSGCVNLSFVNFIEGVALIINNNAFESCTSLTGITFPNSVVGFGSEVLKSTTSLAFLSVPFAGTTKDEDTAPHVDNAGTSLSRLAYMFSPFIPTVDALSFYLTPSVGISSAQFYVPRSLTTVVITSDTNLGARAFAGLESVTSIIIPSNTTRIGVAAFRNTGLRSFTFPLTLTEIDVWAFGDNSYLEFVSPIPNGVTTIWRNLFTNCTKLSSVTFNNLITTFGEAVFANTGLTTFAFPNSMTTIPAQFFMNSKLVSIVIPNQITSIGDESFNNITTLTMIRLPRNASFTAFNNLEYFANCINLRIAIIPASIVTIPLNVFRITSITLVNYLHVYTDASVLPTGWSGSSPNFAVVHLSTQI